MISIDGIFFVDIQFEKLIMIGAFEVFVPGTITSLVYANTESAVSRIEFFKVFLNEVVFGDLVDFYIIIDSVGTNEVLFSFNGTIVDLSNNLDHKGRSVIQERDGSGRSFGRGDGSLGFGSLDERSKLSLVSKFLRSIWPNRRAAEY